VGAVRRRSRPIRQRRRRPRGPTAGALRRPRPAPVTEHVAVFEAEHARLQRELGTIDQL
jgi:hypothetical protein